MNEPVSTGAVLFGAVLVVLVLAASVRGWFAGRGHGRVELTRVGTTAVSAGRVVMVAAVIVAVEWAVLTYAASNIALVLVVLGVPALFAAYTVTKAFAVTEVRSVSARRGGLRR